MPEKPLVGIVMGSDTDLPVMTEAALTLKKFGIPFEIEITSAHRSPVRTSEYARTAGTEIILNIDQQQRLVMIHEDLFL